MAQSSDYTWRNWEHSLTSNAEVVVANDVAALRAVLRQAASAGKTVRVSGGGRGERYSGSFSGSPVVANDGGMIVMTPGLRTGWVDDSNHRLVAGGGMTLAEVGALARRHGLSFETTTAPSFLTVAGAVGTGCHGCGWHGGSLSDLVVGAEILTYDGAILSVDEDDPELLSAAKVSLGALGILLAVTFQLRPEFKLLATDDPNRDMRLTIQNIQSLVQGHDYCELIWYPFNEKIWIKKWDVVPFDTPDTNAPSARQDRFVQWATATFGTPPLVLATHFPSLTPPIARALMAVTAERTMVAPTSQVFHYQNYFPRKLYDLSYAVPTGKDFAEFRTAFLGIVDAIERYAERGIYPVNFLVHCRFLGGSEPYLAPAAGFHGTCMFEVITYVGSEDWSFYGEVEQLFLDLGGRPHWGKNYDTEQDFSALYGDRLCAFESVRGRLDPHGRFLNPFLRHVFGK